MATTPSAFPPHVSGSRQDDPVVRIVALKHRQYDRRAYLSRFAYYLTRTIAGMSAGFLPFVVKTYPNVATALSMAIVVAIVIESVYDPGEKWRTYSKASDLLTVAELQSKGMYENAKQMLDIIQATEAQAVSKLVDIEEVLNKVRKTGGDK